MMIVRLKGGLGNQMFQYALGRVLSLKNKKPLYLDIDFFNHNFFVTKRTFDLNVFNIDARVIDRKYIPLVYRVYDNQHFLRIQQFIKKILRIKGTETSFDFDSSILNSGSNLYLDGYWQSPKYFKGYEDIIKKDFTFKNLPENIKILSDEIMRKNSLCVHIRRGDYVGNKYHEVVNKEYYKKGVELLELRGVKIDQIYVFSDDIKWCQNNLSFLYPTNFVSEDYIGKKNEGHLYLMSKGKYFIIPNSSFSWWAAWLSEREGKVVVCPRQWFGEKNINSDDLIPKEWIRI